MEHFEKKSRLTGKTYDSLEAVAIKNILQAAAYMDNGVMPVDIRPCRNAETGKRFLVFYFIKEETKDVFDKWCRYELD